MAGRGDSSGNTYEATSDRIRSVAASITEELRELLLDRSTLLPHPTPPPGKHVIYLGPSQQWAPLDEGGRVLQARLLANHTRFSELVAAMLCNAPEATQVEIAKQENIGRDLIEQPSGTGAESTEEAFRDARQSVERRVARIMEMYDPSPGQPVVVPDANAIVWNPDLDAWEFEGVSSFTLVLTSTLLGELDSLKVQHRNDDVRTKAAGAIRRIKEYMRRGDIRDGVTLRRDRSIVRMIGPEPNFSSTLPWLDATSKDDRLLASVLEIIREHPHSPVLLVTLDVNMQNKAGHAGIQYIEPPDPPERPARKKKLPDVRIVQFRGYSGSAGLVSFPVVLQNFESTPVQSEHRNQHRRGGQPPASARVEVIHRVSPPGVVKYARTSLRTLLLAKALPCGFGA